MFILDSLFISGLRWVLDNVATVVDAELNDDTALREQIMEAEMRREAGEISDEEFADLEADLLVRIREIKERQRGGSEPIALERQPIDTSGDTHLQVEATVSGDFHQQEQLARSGSSAGSGRSRSSRTKRTKPTTGRRTSRTPRTSRTTRTISDS